MHRFFIAYVTTIFLMLFGFLGYSFFNLNETEWMALGSEDGLFERLSAITFAITSIMGFYVFYKSRVQLHFIFASLMALASMREMDLHKEWTTQSILKSRFYLDEITPIHEKTIGLLVVLFLLYALYKLIRNTPSWVSGVFKFTPQAWTIGMGLGMLVFAKILDSMQRIFPFTKEFHEDNYAFSTLVEESFEMAGALFFLALAIMLTKTVR